VGFLSVRFPGTFSLYHGGEEGVWWVVYTVLVGVCFGDDLGERACRLRWVVCAVLAGVCFGDDLGERACRFHEVCGWAFLSVRFPGTFSF